MTYAQLRALIDPLHRSLYDYDPVALHQAVSQLFHPDAPMHLCHPLGDLDSPFALVDLFADLARAMPDLERRETIRMAGPALSGTDWIGVCGYYTGTMVAPWLDIPPTGHQVAFRFHEFYQVTDGRISEMQAIWDIPELMMQCGVWPMAPSLGRDWQIPGPATQDGLQTGARDETASNQALDLVGTMLANLGKFDSEGVQGMNLPATWHPKMNWYGPAGIGTNRGIAGFRHWHQIPFLKGMPNRKGTGGKGHIFADNHYVGVTGWPNMQMNLTGDGWMGIAPNNQPLTMRSLDFWRCENGWIRENWVTVDLLDVYRQLNVDVFERMRELSPHTLAHHPRSGY